MTKNILLILASTFFCFSTCKKNESSVTISGKLVHRSCASTVVEVLDAAYFNLGQADWQQSPAQPVRHNVFSVENTCEFPAMDTGTVFNFKVITNGRTDCIICMMFDNPPAKKQTIKVLPK